MCSVGRAVFVECIVGVAVVGDDYHFVVIGLASLYGLVHAVVDCNACLFDSFIHTSVTHHVAVSIVNHDEVILLSVDSFHEFVLNFVGAHFRLEVVGSHLWRWHQDAVFAFVWIFAAAIEEECNVCILFCFSYVELLLAKRAEIFAKGVVYVVLAEKHVDASER